MVNGQIQPVFSLRVGQGVLLHNELEERIPKVIRPF
jgi:hypothetical protein